MKLTLPRLSLPMFMAIVMLTTAGCIFAVDTTQLDASVDEDIDVSNDVGSDAHDATDAPECIASSESELCAQYELECGEYEVLDECGTTRSIDCGGCTLHDTCISGICICQPQDRDEFCRSNQAQCGIVEGVDRCGNERRIFCGECIDGEVCPRAPAGAAQLCEAEDVCTPACSEFESCIDQQCVCTSPTDTELCEEHIAEQPDAQACGELTLTDRCGEERAVDCGSCADDGEACSATNVCCIPESDAQLCEANARECGTLDLLDSCGHRRVISCGGCGTQCCKSGVCEPRTFLFFC